MTTDESPIIDESIPCPKCEMRIMPGESCPDCDSDAFDRTLIPASIREIGHALNRIYENDPVAPMVAKAIERLAELFERDGKLSTIEDLDTMVKFLEVPMHVYYPESPPSGFLEPQWKPVESSDFPEIPPWQDRLVIDSIISKKSPVVRGTWVTADKIVSMIVEGWPWSDILRSHPEITEDDIRAALAYTVENDPL